MNIGQYVQLFDSLYANVSDGLLIIDSKTNTPITGNPALCKMLNCTPEEIRNLHIENLHPKEVFESHLKREEEKCVTNTPLIKKDGNKIYVTICNFHIKLEDKKFLVFTYRDFKENKIEHTFVENEELYRMVSENTMDALVVCDEKANYIYTSPSNERIFGYKQGELVGRNAFEFFHPEDVGVNKGRLQLLLEGKEFPSIEFRYKKKNGEYIWCDIAVKLVRSIRGEKRIIVIARDVTERKKLQEELKKYSEDLETMVAQRNVQLNKSKEYLHQLVNRLPLALIAWNREFNITTWNPKASQMFGFSESECLGRKPESLFSPEGENSMDDLAWSKLQNGESADIVTENITKDGKLIVCSWINTPLKDENGNFEGVLSMIEDVTEKKKLEERLKEITYSLSGVKAGESYLTTSLQRSLKIAFDLNNHGTSGLYIVRENPDSIVKDYNFKPQDIILVSQNPIKEFRSVKELQEIAIMISKFLAAGGGVVVLGGLEYLVSRFGFNSVFMMIQEIRFEILEAEATLLVPVNMETLDSREKGLLTSELKLLD